MSGLVHSSTENMRQKRKKRNFAEVTKGQVKELHPRNIRTHKNMIASPSSEKFDEIKEKMIVYMTYSSKERKSISFETNEIE